MKILLVAAARPNFMKIAPLYHELKKHTKYNVKIIHTGQHYDANMSGDFFKEFNLPEPDINLQVNNGTHSEQVANTMLEFEKILFSEKPNLVIVVGDVNATMACSIVAKKENIRVAHLEAGIRSYDMTMPEEINRRVTDSIVDLFWTPSIDANENLVREGVSSKNIVFVGNIMIDTFVMKKKEILKLNMHEKLGLTEKEYVVCTFHRPSNVDTKIELQQILEMLIFISNRIKIIFPVHPRTKSKLLEFDLMKEMVKIDNIIITEPYSYVPFMSLVYNAKFILTDSGGIQEETTYLGIPCLTFRENTERPITISEGTNTLVNINNYSKEVNNIMNNQYKKSSIPLFWDGMAASRVVKSILNYE